MTHTRFGSVLDRTNCALRTSSATREARQRQAVARIGWTEELREEAAQDYHKALYGNAHRCNVLSRMLGDRRIAMQQPARGCIDTALDLWPPGTPLIIMLKLMTEGEQ